MDRRRFLRGAAAAGLVVGAGVRPGALADLLAAGREGSVADGGAGVVAPVAGGAVRTPLRIPPVVSPDGLTLTAGVAEAEIAPGVVSPVWTLGDGPTGPTIDAVRGARARITLRNEIAEPTILHWHGVRPPESADGHPRYHVHPGGTYDYDFELDEPAGTYWYHPHAHEYTAEQVYRGMAGFLIVREEAETSLGLPSRARELPLLMQDRRLDAEGRIVYGARGHDLMEGLLGDVPFVNGVRSPVVEVDSAVYRLRLLCAANARVFRLALSNGRPFRLIAGDAGLLDAPVEIEQLDLATGERADVLVDFSGLPAGTRVMLKSLGFPGYAGMSAGGMGGMGMGGRITQALELDVLEFVVTREVREEALRLPSFPGVPRLARESAARTRHFRMQTTMMSHTINGVQFEPDRADERVRFGDTEIWTFENPGPFPHPVHLHGAHFQILARTGGRARIHPWETGWKDTVLLLPQEQVEVIMKFDRHRGLFLLHCHNLEHEDMGMMLNFLIE